MGKKIFRVVILLAVIATVAAGIYYYRKNGEAPADRLRLYGNVDIRQVQLAFEDVGRIEAIYVTEGDRVAPGDLVARIDPVRYRSAVAAADAKVASQKQVLARLIAGSRDEEIAAAKARVSAAQAAEEDARSNYERAKQLADTQFVSRQKLDTAEAALKTAEANLDARQQELALAVKGPRQEDIDAARATLEAYKAEQALATQRLKDTDLTAPAGGVIRDRISEPGDMAFPQTPVLTLALTNPLWVRAYVDETNLGKIAPGMKAEVVTDSYPDKTYAGWIGYISPTAEFTPKTVQTEELRSKLVYQVRVYVCNPENQLRLGMPATVTIDLDQPERNKPDPNQPEPDRPSPARPVDPCGEKKNA